MYRRVVVLIAIAMFFSSYGWHDQVAISQKTNELSSWYIYSKIFDDQFTQQGRYEFSIGRTQIYKSKNVKEVRIKDMEGNLMFYCQLDTSGRVKEQGVKAKNFFIKYKTIEVDQFSYIKTTSYFKNNHILKLDTILGYYQEYKMADTSLYYSRETVIQYLLGSVINERNEYYNTKYYDKPVVNSPTWMLTINYPYYLEEEDHKYYTQKYRTDYYSGKLYKVSHSVSTQGYHHYKGTTELDGNIINWHPFFKGVSENDKYEFYVDGANFIEPRTSYERMWCGNSLSNSYYYNDDGKHYRYSKRPDGLYDTYYLDFYEEDKSPPPPPKKVVNEDTAIAASNIVLLADIYGHHRPRVRRVSTPIRTELFCYEYSFYNH